MAVAARTPSPSSLFTALLRRSKFASYDPRIGQVYTSYDGYVHRGDFGLKRPLPIRTRGWQRNITVSDVDSNQQQTEWKSAHSEARWIKIWDEVGVHPKNTDYATWTTRLGPTSAESFMDSEFTHKEGETVSAGVVNKIAQFSPLYGPQSTAVPNIEAMSNRQFEAYLNHIRKLRPAFKDFVREVSSKKLENRESVIPSTLFELAKNPGTMHKRFLQRQAYDHYNTPDSRIIEQQPSPAAGLSYTKTSQLQSLLFTKPHKGRMLQPADNSTDAAVAGYAGMNVYVPREFKSSTPAVDWETLATSGHYEEGEGVTNFRIIDAELQSAPNVVGKAPQGTESVRMATYVFDADSKAVSFGRSNPHRPGSREYIDHVDDTQVAQPAPLLKFNYKTKPAKAGNNHSGAVLATLAGVLAEAEKARSG